MKFLKKLQTEAMSEYAKSQKETSAHKDAAKAHHQAIIENHKNTRSRIDDKRKCFSFIQYK